MNERDLFIHAFQQPGAAERAAFLDQACAGDAALRRRVEILLKADTEAREVLRETAPLRVGRDPAPYRTPWRRKTAPDGVRLQPRS